MVCEQMRQRLHMTHLLMLAGGVLRFELDRGVPLEPLNTYPSLRVILAKNGTHF